MSIIMHKYMYANINMKLQNSMLCYRIC